MKKIYDLTERRFGRLVVVKYVKRTKSGNHFYWLCKCDCGKKNLVIGSNLRRGHTQSCGCLKKESIQKIGQNTVIHGDARGKAKGIYLTWMRMKSRCYYPNDISYKYYGERGIIVCDEWKENYLNFKNWALLNGYKDGLTIDRIDPKGNYEPNNCQWLTKSKNSKKCQLQLKDRYICLQGET